MNSFYIFCGFMPLYNFYMVSMEIVSFCRIILVCNFQYRNHVHCITLMSCQIISQNVVQILSMTLIKVLTSLDVSAVAGHHAMPAALLFLLMYMHTICTYTLYSDRLGFK